MEEDIAKMIRDGDGISFKSNEAADDNATATFLGLPPEIRNMIYTLCLAEDEIEITKQMKPPALLLTCRQVRSEAVPIWFGSNRFEIVIEACDSTLFRRFSQNLADSIIARTGGQGSPVGISIERVNWANFVERCQAIWRKETGRCRPAHDPDDEDENYAIIAAATTIAVVRRADLWEKVEHQLTALRPVAIKLNAQWKD